MHQESKMFFVHCMTLRVNARWTTIKVPKACHWIMKNLWKDKGGNLSFEKNGTKEKGLMSIKECGIQPWIGPIILALTIPQSITRSIFVFYTAARSFMKNQKTIYIRLSPITLLQKQMKNILKPQNLTKESNFRAW